MLYFGSKWYEPILWNFNYKSSLEQRTSSPVSLRIFCHLTIKHRSKQESVFILKKKKNSLRPKVLKSYIIHPLACVPYVSILYITPVVLIFVKDNVSLVHSEVCNLSPSIAFCRAQNHP